MKTSTKITIGIVAITSLILIFINLFVFYRTQSAFQEGIKQYEVERQKVDNNPDVLIIRPAPTTPRAFPNVEQKFYDNLTLALTLAALFGTGLALLAGAFFSRVITRPLNHLKGGMQSFRNKKEKIILAKSGEQEFDVVIDEFNTLVTELNYQEELQKNLISDVAHELKTPITALNGQLQAVKDKVLNLDEKRIDILLAEINRLSSLTDSLNEYTKLKSQFPNLHKEEINLKDFFSTLSFNYETILKDNNMKFDISISDLAIVSADRSLFHRAISNLIDNAISYSQGNVIKINYDNNLLTIEDNGVGIDPEHQTKVFERFYRVEKSRNRNTGGLGLGLTIVKEIIEAHGWSIGLESDKSGTKFLIEIKS